MRSLVGKRKTATAPLVRGGNQLQGVQITDPGGRPTVVPFTGSADDVLRGDGTFGAVAGGTGDLSITDGYWAPVMAGDPFASTAVVTNTYGDAVMVFRRTR